MITITYPINGAVYGLLHIEVTIQLTAHTIILSNSVSTISVLNENAIYAALISYKSF